MMKVLIFGATGMVGQGALRECLVDPGVESVVAIGRRATGVTHGKLSEIIHEDMSDFEPLADRLTGFDACFYCLGVTSLGMKEADYERITYGIGMAAGKTLSRLNPGMAFIFISGQGADSSEKGCLMWARIKGKTENALKRLPFKAVYTIRLGAVQPLDGIRSKTRIYSFIYAFTGPVFAGFRWAFPRHVTTTQELGRAMIALARRGFHKPLLAHTDISAAAQPYPALIQESR